MGLIKSKLELFERIDFTLFEIYDKEPLNAQELLGICKNQHTLPGNV